MKMWDTATIYDEMHCHFSWFSLWIIDIIPFSLSSNFHFRGFQWVVEATPVSPYHGLGKHGSVSAHVVQAVQVGMVTGVIPPTSSVPFGTGMSSAVIVHVNGAEHVAIMKHEPVTWKAERKEVHVRTGTLLQRFWFYACSSLSSVRMYLVGCVFLNLWFNFISVCLKVFWISRPLLCMSCWLRVSSPLI